MFLTALWVDNTKLYSKIRVGVGHTDTGIFADTDFIIDELHISEVPATHQQMFNLNSDYQ